MFVEEPFVTHCYVVNQCVQSDIFSTSLLVPHFNCHYNQFAAVTNTITVYIRTYVNTYICAHKTCCYEETVILDSGIIERSHCIEMYLCVHAP